jgi:hypothetical protein
VDHELGDIDPHIDRAEILRHPTPALHVDDEPLDVLRLGFTLGAGLEQRLTQTFELLVLGVQRREIGIRRLRRGDLAQHRPRVTQRRLLAEHFAECGRIGTAAARVAGIFQINEIELDLRLGLLFGRRQLLVRGRQLEGALSSPQSSALPISSMTAWASAQSPASSIHSGGPT